MHPSSVEKTFGNDRRLLLQALAAAPLIVGSMWSCSSASDKQPTVFAAARRGKQAVLCGLNVDGKLCWELPVPRRAHDVALHPHKPQLAFMGRRPGQKIWWLNRETGELEGSSNAPANTQFNGHAAYSADGSRLLTTETAFPGNVGQIGVYESATHNRVGSFSSGGLDPHQLLLLPENDVLVIANGGKVESSPFLASGVLSGEPRSATMDRQRPPSLSTVDSQTGELLSSAVLPTGQHSLSIRHLAAVNHSTVAVGLQRQSFADEEGETLGKPLMFLVNTNEKSGQEWQSLGEPEGGWSILNGYVGSVAANIAKSEIAATSPRGDCLVRWSVDSGVCLSVESGRDMSGVAPLENSFVSTSGTGQFNTPSSSNQLQGLEFDNHCASWF